MRVIIATIGNQNTPQLMFNVHLQKYIFHRVRTLHRFRSNVMNHKVFSVYGEYVITFFKHTSTFTQVVADVNYWD